MQRGWMAALALLLITATSVACSSGSSGSGETGTFVDGPVQGLRYVGPTFSGVTNERGEYQFLPGEIVCFFLGRLELGCVLASGVVTPIDLFEGGRSDEERVMNVVRLLLSLDLDEDPDNGLDVTGVPTDAEDPDIDFEEDSDDFEEDSNVRDFVSRYGPRTDLVDEEDAEDHFEDSLRDVDYFARRLDGEWLYTRVDNDYIFSMPTQVRSFEWNAGTVEQVDLEVSEDGDVDFAFEDDEDCEHSGSIESEDRSLIFGSVYCDRELFAQTEGLRVVRSLTSFRMDRLDPTTEYDVQDLLGAWYRSQSMDEGQIQFVEPVANGPEIEIGGPGIFFIDEDELAAGNATISASGAVRFEYDEIDGNCIIEGQMNATKSYVAGTERCDGEDEILFTLERAEEF